MNTVVRIVRTGCLSIVVLGSPGLSAQDGETKSTSKFSVEGQIELELAGEFNFDLEDDEDEYIIEPTIELEFEYEKNDSLRALLNLEYGREVEDGNQGRDREYSSSFVIDEAFVEFSGFEGATTSIEDITLTLGRRKISDPREWFYDAGVDGLIFEAKSVTTQTDLMVSINREEWVGSDMLRSNETDTVSNFIFALEHQPTDNLEVSAFAIIRSDSSEDDDSPRFIGLTASGEMLDERLKFWSGLAVASGEEEEEKINGTGLDLGATWTLFDKDGPYVSLAYAFGSGDGDEDTDFRQTGLHGNSGRFGGVTNFKYYGELVEPELSNLKILTAGIGIRPFKKASLDLVYHRYEQDVALDELRDSNLNRDPNGESTDIGAELDLIAGFTIGAVETDWVLGYFLPGDAFDDDDTDEAYFFNASFTYEF